MSARFDSLKGNSIIRDISVITGGVMVSNGITSYIPDLQPVWMILGGIGLSYVALNMERQRHEKQERQV